MWLSRSGEQCFKNEVAFKLSKIGRVRRVRSFECVTFKRAINHRRRVVLISDDLRILWLPFRTRSSWWWFVKRSNERELELLRAREYYLYMIYEYVFFFLLKSRVVFVWSWCTSIFWAIFFFNLFVDWEIVIRMLTCIMVSFANETQRWIKIWISGLSC